jgi:hypothetical protein
MKVPAENWWFDVRLFDLTSSLIFWRTVVMSPNQFFDFFENWSKVHIPNLDPPGFSLQKREPHNTGKDLGKISCRK